MSARRFSWRHLSMALILAIGALLLFAGAFAAGYVAIHRDKIVPGVSVGGIDIGGLDRSAAEDKLRLELPDVRAGKLVLMVDERQFAITHSEIGRGYDLDSMLDRAFAVARTGDTPGQLVQHLRTLVDRADIDTEIIWNRDLLNQRVRQIAALAASDARNAIITKEGARFTVIASVNGTVVDADAAVAAANAALVKTDTRDTTASVATNVVLAPVSTPIARAAAGGLNRIVDQPLTVMAGAREIIVTPDELAAWVTAAVDATGRWSPRLDEGAIGVFTANVKSGTDLPARDGTYEFIDGRPVVVPAQRGLALDANAAVRLIRDALLARARGATTLEVALPTTVLSPRITTAGAQDLVARVTKLSSWTTEYEPSSMNGYGVNIRRPTELIDGTVVNPGERFDFVAIAGPITTANGYTDGAAIINGNTKLDGVVGGGLCSASTTLFNAALRAGLQIDARRAHAYYINRYPVGLDATIWVSGVKVQTVAFTNDLPYPILVRGINRRGTVTYQIYGVPDGRRVSFTEPEVTNERQAWTEFEYTDDLPAGLTQRVEYAFDGFDSVVTRTVIARDESIVHADTFRSSYRRVIGVILVGRSPEDPPSGTRVRRP